MTIAAAIAARKRASPGLSISVGAWLGRRRRYTSAVFSFRALAARAFLQGIVAPSVTDLVEVDVGVNEVPVAPLFFA